MDELIKRFQVLTHRVLDRMEMIVTMTNRSSRGVAVATAGTLSEEEKNPKL